MRDPLLSTIVEGVTPGRFDRLGVAVSGGGDSVALLHLLAEWRDAAGGPPLAAVTVDHGLRAEASAEAEGVARLCHGLKVPHRILRWQGWDGRGNLQDRARQARQTLISGWAREEGLRAVVLGHTADDQAETVLLRLARGSGVDGLAGMAAERRSHGVIWLRPMLGLRRAALRQWLSAHGIGWVDDPSNDDPRFDRVKARAALAVLEPLGLGVAGLIGTADRLRMAQAVLQSAARRAARDLARTEAGGVVLAPGLRELAEETRLRLISAALRWIGREPYRPRLAALRRAVEAAMEGRAATLAGCLILPEAGALRLVREPAAVVGLTAPADAVWDGRWRIEGPPAPGAEIRALGPEGLAACPDWRAAGLPRAALLATPALWQGDRLLSAPFAGQGAGWRAVSACGEEDAFDALFLD